MLKVSTGMMFFFSGFLHGQYFFLPAWNYFFSMQKRYDAPWLTIDSIEIVQRFMQRFGIRHEMCFPALIGAIANAFSAIPYENLTKIIKNDAVISSSSALRFPDELLRDFLNWGSGGTCFSLTAALIALLDMFGCEAYPLLADRHYGVDTHCGVLLITPSGEMQLLDPGYLFFTPRTLNAQSVLSFDSGFNRIELKPVHAGAQVELWTISNHNRKRRLTYKMQPVSDDVFKRAWERSFAFEMMTYPILTRQHNGCHLYLQNNTLMTRSAHGTERVVLSAQEKVSCITSTFGINSTVTKKALEILNGRAASGSTS